MQTAEGWGGGAGGVRLRCHAEVTAGDSRVRAAESFYLLVDIKMRQKSASRHRSAAAGGKRVTQETSEAA